MGVMSAKLFSAMVGGMTSDNLHNPDVLKGIGEEFGNVFSDKDFEGKDSNYPYSQKYFTDRENEAMGKLKKAWDDTVDRMRGVNLGGSSGSEAVRQARMNASDMPGKVKESEFKDKTRLN